MTLPWSSIALRPFGELLSVSNNMPGGAACNARAELRMITSSNEAQSCISALLCMCIVRVV